MIASKQNNFGVGAHFSNLFITKHTTICSLSVNHLYQSVHNYTPLKKSPVFPSSLGSGVRETQVSVKPLVARRLFGSKHSSIAANGMGGGETESKCNEILVHRSPRHVYTSNQSRMQGREIASKCKKQTSPPTFNFIPFFEIRSILQTYRTHFIFLGAMAVRLAVHYCSPPSKF